jgi:hypothetical protein
MSTYIRKTEDEYEIQQYTPYGWELATTETNRKDAREQLRCYRENAREQLRCYRENDPSGSYRIIKKRVPIEVTA